MIPFNWILWRDSGYEIRMLMRQRPRLNAAIVNGGV